MVLTERQKRIVKILDTIQVMCAVGALLVALYGLACALYKIANNGWSLV